jgi:hypothetical protein
VIAATDSPAAALACVESLGPDLDADRVEAIVAAPGWIAPRGLRLGARWVTAAASSGVPTLRCVGLEHSRAPIVLFTEDACRFVPGWFEAWLDAFEDAKFVAATGSIEQGCDAGPREWAVYFCEYASFYRAPGRRGCQTLAGNYFAVRRAIAAELALGGAIDEFEIACELCQRGLRTAWVEGPPARHVRRYSTAEIIRDRLRFGMEFGLRAASARSAAIRALAGPAILVVQAARLSATIARAPGLWIPFLETLPVTLALLAAWSVGEWFGSVRSLFGHLSCRRHETTGRSAAQALVQAGEQQANCRPVQAIA